MPKWGQGPRRMEKTSLNMVDGDSVIRNFLIPSHPSKSHQTAQSTSDSWLADSSYQRPLIIYISAPLLFFLLCILCRGGEIQIELSRVDDAPWRMSHWSFFTLCSTAFLPHSRSMVLSRVWRSFKHSLFPITLPFSVCCVRYSCELAVIAPLCLAEGNILASDLHHPWGDGGDWQSAQHASAGTVYLPPV